MMVSASANASGGNRRRDALFIRPMPNKRRWRSPTAIQERLLINAWIENANGQKEKPFAVTAAVYQRAGCWKHLAHYLRRPGAACRSRIALYMNVKAIPSASKNIRTATTSCNWLFCQCASSCLSARLTWRDAPLKRCSVAALSACRQTASYGEQWPPYTSRWSIGRRTDADTRWLKPG